MTDKIDYEIDYVIRVIDRKIAVLNETKEILLGVHAVAVSQGKAKAAKPADTPTKPTKNRMSVAGRKRIADAQRKRWAEARKTAAAEEA
jgi:hypothetical protein